MPFGERAADANRSARSFQVLCLFTSVNVDCENNFHRRLFSIKAWGILRGNCHNAVIRDIIASGCKLATKLFRQQIYRIRFKWIANWLGAPPALSLPPWRVEEVLWGCPGCWAAGDALPGRRKGWGQLSEVSFKDLFQQSLLPAIAGCSSGPADQRSLFLSLPPSPQPPPGAPGSPWTL